MTDAIASAGEAALSGKPPDTGRGRAYAAAAAALFAIHLIGLASIFERPSDIWNAEPLVEQDYGLHFHHLISMKDQRAAEGRGWGYNPRFMGGYVSNTIQDASIKLFEFAALLAPDPVRAFKLLAILSAALAPAVMFASGMILFGERRAAFWMALLGTVYWWNSYPREMFFYGMIGFPLASLACVLTVAAAGKFLDLAASEAGRRNLVALWTIWTLLCAALPPLHLQSAVILLPPMIALAGWGFARGGWQRVMMLVLGAAIGASVSWPWLSVFVRHRGDDISAGIVRELGYFVSRDPLAFAKDYLGLAPLWTFRETRIEGFPRLALLALGLAGFWAWMKAGRRELALPWMTAAGSMFALAYFGSLIPALAAWQPLRFKVPLDLFLIPPAASFIASGALSLRLRTRPVKAAWATAAAIAFGAFGLNLAQSEFSGAMRMRAGLTPRAKEIVAWAQALPRDGRRILFEESGDESGFVYDGIYLSSFLAHLADRELIGGPANYYNDRHHHANFFSGRLFGRAIESMDYEEIARILDLYNIGAVVAHDSRSIEKLGSLGGIVRLDKQLGGIALMQVTDAGGALLAGEGKVRARIGGIECEGLGGSAVVLKYRWVEGLASDPQARITPFIPAGSTDFLPFIRIENPPLQLTLRIAP